MLLEPGLGRRREGVGKGDQAGCLIHRPAALAPHGAEPEGEADEMGFGLAAPAEQRRDQQTPEPGAMLQRRDLLPGIEREGGGENRRQGRGFCDDGPPVIKGSGHESAFYAPFARTNGELMRPELNSRFVAV